MGMVVRRRRCTESGMAVPDAQSKWQDREAFGFERVRSEDEQVLIYSETRPKSNTRNRISVQFVPGMRFLVLAFGVDSETKPVQYKSTSKPEKSTAEPDLCSAKRLRVQYKSTAVLRCSDARYVTVLRDVWDCLGVRWWYGATLCPVLPRHMMLRDVRYVATPCPVLSLGTFVPGGGGGREDSGGDEGNGAHFRQAGTEGGYGRSQASTERGYANRQAGTEGGYGRNQASTER
eukprot:1111549-Rhodomonas_salina.1